MKNTARGEDCAKCWNIFYSIFSNENKATFCNKPHFYCNVASIFDLKNSVPFKALFNTEIAIMTVTDVLQNICTAAMLAQ